MKNIYPLLILTVLYLTTPFFFAKVLFAEDSPAQGEKQAGFIDIELDSEKKESTPYKTLTSNLTKKLSEFASSIKETKKKGAVDAPIFSADELRYLAATHLHCTLIAGACPLIPAALFEIDLVRSINSGTPHCAALTPFWKQWIDSDMEKRVDLNLKVTLFNQRSNFKKNIRPKYLRCQATIKQMLDSIEDADYEKFLSARYAEDGQQISKLVEYLEQLNQKIENIFDETGLQALKGNIR